MMTDHPECTLRSFNFVFLPLALLGILFLASCKKVDPIWDLEFRSAIQSVNTIVNNYEYVSDQEQFGTEEYWQTPSEFLVVNKKGDCEDFVIGKAHLLVMGGWVDSSDLSFLLLKPRTPASRNHLVLAVNNRVILDNNSEEIYPLETLLEEYIVLGKIPVDRFLRQGGAKSPNLLWDLINEPS